MNYDNGGGFGPSTLLSYMGFKVEELLEVQQFLRTHDLTTKDLKYISPTQSLVALSRRVAEIEASLAAIGAAARGAK